MSVSKVALKVLAKVLEVAAIVVVAVVAYRLS